VDLYSKNCTKITPKTSPSTIAPRVRERRSYPQPLDELLGGEDPPRGAPPNPSKMRERGGGWRSSGEAMAAGNGELRREAVGGK
jgi:hypothetical protein